MKIQNLSEADIRAKFITPAIKKAGWDESQILREDYFTAGRILHKGKLHARGKKKRYDYLLCYKNNIPLAIVEAKDNTHAISSGIQQAIDYANTLDLPFAYTSNGEGFYEHDKTLVTGQLEREISLDEFPSPEELWNRYKKYKGIEDPEIETIVKQDYFFDPQGRKPRYYQCIAINRTVEAVAKGENRILLVMATGTGKTYTAFQIIHRLWKSNAKKRILFLADRTALIDQTRRGDFKHFRDKMTIIKKKVVTVKENGSEKEVLVSNQKRGIDTADKAYEIFLGLYQGLTNYDGIEDAYKDFSPDFFDLIIVDECHRGSAAADSAWRQILEYFSAATHIGLTATPRETKEISNIEYFGEPVYTYSLKQGIEDGFLAPYKVIRISLDKDLEGYRPEKGKTDKDGNELEDRVYNLKDFDRNLVIDERTEMVAKKITEFLKATNRFDKTIVFCVDIEHANRMRNALVNENKDLVAINSKYVMKITGDDEEGKRELDSFTNPEEKYPVITTTSKLMSTGIDAQTCKLIVLDSNIGSMTEFKQIIGRGTRINEEYGKFSFTIMDFRNVTDLFSDPQFDGDPVRIYEPKQNEPVITDDFENIDETENLTEEEKKDTTEIDEPETSTNEPGQIIKKNREKQRKIYVNGVEIWVVNERVQYYGADGKLITESLKDYTSKAIKQTYHSLDEFLTKWNSAEKKQAIIDELLEQGIFIEELEEKVGKDLDVFDLICHVAFGMPPLTRRERVENVKKRNYFTKYGGQARKVIDALLEKYADTGIINIEDPKILTIDPINKMGAPAQIVKLFGGIKYYNEAIHELEKELYKTTA
jgi:type I restriction enzyme, R subunit